MPNWKTYESSVRLLSAILAAHPEIKLNYSAIADKYEEGVTAKAVSTRFERLKKEPSWLGNSTNGDSSRSSAPKAPRTPKKKATKKAASDEDNEDDDEAEISPSKFTPKQSLNKTKEGRIVKNRTPRKAATAVPTYVESGDEDEEDDVDEYTEDKISSIVLKPETNDNGAVFSNGESIYHTANGLSNGNSNGYLNGYEVEGDEVFHLAPGQQYENDFDDDQV